MKLAAESDAPIVGKSEVAMSYAFHVTVSGGQAVVTSQTSGPDAPPDGVYTFSGSVGGGLGLNETAESIGVSRNDLPLPGNQQGVGTLRASASAYVLQQAASSVRIEGDIPPDLGAMST